MPDPTDPWSEFEWVVQHVGMWTVYHKGLPELLLWVVKESKA